MLLGSLSSDVCLCWNIIKSWFVFLKCHMILVLRFRTSIKPWGNIVSIDAPWFSRCIVGLFREWKFLCPGRILWLRQPLKSLNTWSVPWSDNWTIGIWLIEKHRWSRRSDEVQTEHQNGEERWFKWMWMWHGCGCQMGWSEYFRNCWSAGIFMKNHLGLKKRKYPMSGSSVGENARLVRTN